MFETGHGGSIYYRNHQTLQIWASSPDHPKLVVKHLAVHHYLALSITGRTKWGDGYKVFRTTFGAWQGMGVIIVISDSGCPHSSSFLIPLLPQISSFFPEQGVPLSKSSSSSLFLTPCSLSLNRHELGIYCGPSLQPGATDKNMVGQNPALVFRCSQALQWTGCNWVYEGHLLPTLWKSEESEGCSQHWKLSCHQGSQGLWRLQGNFSYKVQPSSLRWHHY